MKAGAVAPQYCCHIHREGPLYEPCEELACWEVLHCEDGHTGTRCYACQQHLAALKEPGDLFKPYSPPT
jgi:hypothetical protein